MTFVVLSTLLFSRFLYVVNDSASCLIEEGRQQGGAPKQMLSTAGHGKAIGYGQRCQNCEED